MKKTIFLTMCFAILATFPSGSLFAHKTPGEKVDQAIDKTKEGYEHAKEKTKEGYEHAKERTKEKYNETLEKSKIKDL